MKFKALIFDLDGTALPTGRESVPSPKVIEAVAQAKKIISVSIATARRISSLKEIFKTFSLKSPSIIMGGTTIINPQTEEIVWQKLLDPNTVKLVAEIAKKYPGEIIMGDSPFYDRQKSFQINKCSVIYLRNPSHKIADKITEELKLIPDISYIFAISWIKGWTDIHVTHKKATKKNAVQELMKILNVKKEEIIVVGDSFNDLPLFESAGFKVAMGNAEESLKAKADFIAPTVYEDGLAEVIEKFILQ
ncbi:MAG: HAD-superfamily hydrolase, subfamily IIB [Candidatus Roizmanbacteria bacterium GW2011_GWA2_35_8]|uniref:HAD-superfamily hydrolase, subfamily IIB n=1 Tax=Candidatus Roizmanbacteria bacterium GW2011_GWA2_35_8 TaxID=1618479 RepID=A0A0G0CYU1_9BACT|nr:MAG: HAD-superfamily hydrolase, subfamily IIB [Candidatus Roizmanbacteria bacterium GW2011_GWA2_35_8]